MRAAPFLRRGAAIAAVGALIAWPTIMSSPYDLRLFTMVGIFAVLVIGYQFIFGLLGELSLAQGAFFGFAAYVTGILAARAGWAFPETFALSIAATVALAALISVPVLRLGSHYFALATLGIGQVVLLVAVDWQSLTGGAMGLTGVPLPTILGLQISRGWPLLIFVWGFVCLSAVLACQVKRGLYGLACHVVRSDALAAQSLGIDPSAVRFAMFLLSAALAGAAGALHAHTIRIVSPEALDFKVMIACMTMAVIGGRTNVWGAVIGAFIIVQLPEWLRGFEQGYLLITSGILLALLVVAPEGVMGLVDRLLPRLAKPQSHIDGAVQHLPEGRTLLPSETPILAINHVSKLFGGVHALDEVSFALKRGSITAVIGPNGSGKTTLVNCITGVYTPEQGDIVLANANVAGSPVHDISSRGVARTFQNLRLVEDMSVLDNVAVARFRAEQVTLRRSILTGRQDDPLARSRSYATSVLGRFGIAHLAHKRCGDLAHGTKRLVEIARAVSLEPMLLLLDEPAAGLNETEQSALAEHLQNLAANGLTLLIIEHNTAFLSTLATDMVCLDYGRLIAAGRPQAIYADERVIEAYLGSGHLSEVTA